MAAFAVKRTYKQLLAERNAIQLLIKKKEKLYFEETRKHVSGESKNYTPVQLAGEIESDKALLLKIENDIERAREKIALPNVLPK